MDKKEFFSELKGLNAIHPAVAIIPQFTEGWLDYSHQCKCLDIEDDDDMPTIGVYFDQESFLHDLQANIQDFDPFEGCDDQYFDYNLSQLESILFASFQLPPIDQAQVFHQLIPILQSFIQDEEQDENMRNIYKSHLEVTIGNKDITNLTGYELYNEIKQSL